MAETGNEISDNYGDKFNHSYGMDNDGSPMNKYFDVEANEWHSHYYYDDCTDEKQTIAIPSRVKRARRTKDKPMRTFSHRYK